MNRAKCTKCDTIVHSKHRHDMVTCKCGRVFVDGGDDYRRLGFQDRSDILIVNDDGTMQPLQDPKPLRNRKIHIVIGPPGSGKSTYIFRELKGLVNVDIWGYQASCMNQRDVFRSYVRHRRDCIEIAKVIPGDFVVEHTLMKAIRRVYYIHRLKEYGRLICHYTTDGGEYGDSALKVYELPTLDEGFDELIPIKRKAWHDI